MADPVLVYDDACGFCTWWADFVAAHSQVDVVGFSALSEAHLERLPAGYHSCAHLLTEETVYACGEAVEAALCRLDGMPAALQQPGPIRRHATYKRIRERVYRWVADNRGRLGWFLSKPAPARENKS